MLPDETVPKTEAQVEFGDNTYPVTYYVTIGQTKELGRRLSRDKLATERRLTVVCNQSKWLHHQSSEKYLAIFSIPDSWETSEENHDRLFYQSG